MGKRRSLGSRIWLALLLGILVPGQLVAACASCEAKCVGAHAQINASPDVREVTACDDDQHCVHQSFGVADDTVISRSVTMVVTARGKDVRLTISGVTNAGTQIGAQTVSAKVGGGSCGCPDPAQMFISPEGAVATASS